MIRKIVVNARYRLRPTTGVERYAQEIVSRWGPAAWAVEPPRWALGIKGHLWEQGVLPLQLGSEDILWSPANSGPILAKRQVLSLHDVSVLEHPEWFSRSFSRWYRILIPKLIRRVRKIITDSEFSKQRILELFDLESRAVIVINPGVDHKLFHPQSDDNIQAVLSRYKLKPDYILSVGSIEPRKNYSRLIIAWNSLTEKYPELMLVIIGRRRGNFRPLNMALMPGSVKILEGVDDDDLASLYAGAAFCVFPSIYEGFGLPLLEAMACGTPVIASDIPAFTEVTGEAAWAIDPLDTDSMAEALENLIGDIKLRKQMRERGFEQVEQFSWEQTAEAIWEVCNNV